MRRFCVLILSTIFVTIIGCSSEPETYTVEEVEGVRYVHNLAPEWGDESRIDLEFVRKYGELESEDENLQLYRPGGLVADSKGDIYILDSGNFLVKKFNSNGEFMFSFGSKGQGPGEFQAPFGMNIDIEDNIYIADYTNQVIHVFDSSGRFIRGIKAGQSLMPQSLLIIDPEKLVVKYQGLVDPEKAEKEKLVKIIDGNGEITGGFGQRRTYEDEMLNFIGNDFFFAHDRE
ncbi:MAG: 6-bladed beta-propeller, partial [bacterium]|nr:6-bladed beta-propeller [bacterium]